MGLHEGELLPGSEVQARGLRWEVVFSEEAGGQRLYRLRGLDGALIGQELDVLYPFEPIEPIAQALDLEKPAPLDHWRVYHQAFLLEQALGPRALLAAQPGRLRIEPYQLVPVLRALEMSRTRLLLADGVGLGKTVQAGLVLAELVARRRAHRILIVSPAGPLLEQWRTEMRERFGLRFRVLDGSTLQQIRFETELGANPFERDALGLISIDFAKQEKVLQDLDRTRYDVVVIDEAHHVARLGAAGDREDSLRRNLAEVLARRSDALLLLTATPHDGHDAHFASLVELLDPSLVNGRSELRGEAYLRHLVRRLKRHIRDPETGDPLFLEREVTPHPVGLDPASRPIFAALQRGLLALVAPQLRKARRQRRYADALAFVALLKRGASTARAVRTTLHTVAERFRQLHEQESESQESRRQRLKTLRDYRRRLDRFGSLTGEEERDQAALEADDMAAMLHEAPPSELGERLGELEREVRRERRRLSQTTDLRDSLQALADLAVEAEAEDPKLPAIADAIMEIRAAEPAANVLVYSEYTDSQEAVVEHLLRAREEGQLTGEVMTIRGLDSEMVRLRTTERFRTEDDLVLVSTDATAEGLNLHDRCHHLLHVELPYNPNRLEQRNGRIDRFGQKQVPKVRYLFLQGTFEERLLARLVAKYERQRSRLTFMPNTLGVMGKEDGRVLERLLDGLAEEEGTLFSSPDTVAFSDETTDVESEAYRDLLSEVERATLGFEKAAETMAWLGDLGSGAGIQNQQDAEKARSDGAALGVSDLLGFVMAAVRADASHPHAVTRPGPEFVELKLRPEWTHGLDELPGWDPDRRGLLLTTNPERMTDDGGRPVGFLGRAHPIVRRALDRIRNVRFGESGGWFDRRVAVARSDYGERELLYTFLGQVQSAAGRLFERVVAVHVVKGQSPRVLPEHESWSSWADASRAMTVQDAWRGFEAWAPSWDEVSEAASTGFASWAQTFVEGHERDLQTERDELHSWLKERDDDLCGPRAIQAELFEDGAPVQRWRTLEEPQARLASFAEDPTRSRPEQREARTVLDLYADRMQALDRRADPKVLPPSPLGLLMLVPEVT